MTLRVSHRRPTRFGLAVAVSLFGAITATASYAEGVSGAPAPAPAGSLVAARAIVVKSVVKASDVKRSPEVFDGAATALDDVVGLEARVTIYPGRPILPGDLGPPALVERNEIVSLSFARGVLNIRTEARALDRGAKGERVRVMNLTSRTIVSGVVEGEHAVAVRR